MQSVVQTILIYRETGRRKPTGTETIRRRFSFQQAHVGGVRRPNPIVIAGSVDPDIIRRAPWTADEIVTVFAISSLPHALSDAVQSNKDRSRGSERCR